MELIGWALPEPATGAGRQLALPALPVEGRSGEEARPATSPRAESAGDEPEPDYDDVDLFLANQVRIEENLTELML
eukprot:15302694-Alexandrium_andersonii.AAC.1